MANKKAYLIVPLRSTMEQIDMQTYILLKKADEYYKANREAYRGTLRTFIEGPNRDGLKKVNAISEQLEPTIYKWRSLIDEAINIVNEIDSDLGRELKIKHKNIYKPSRDTKKMVEDVVDLIRSYVDKVSMQ